MKSTLLLFAVIILGSCTKSKIDRSVQNFAKVDYEEVKTYFQPLPERLVDISSPIMASRAKLGKKLYFETQLSIAGDISCNSCHLLDNYGVDNEPTSPGHLKQLGNRNSPSVYNSGLHIAQFWDGRAKDLKEQAMGPVLNPVEMAMPDETVVIQRLKSIDDYADMFKAAFPKDKASQAISFNNMAEAIALFEMNLLTPSRFDHYLKGKRDALSDDEKEGLRLFVEVGCVSCHDGVGIGGGSYQMLGAVVPYETKDLGRFAVTKEEDDKFFFKVPSLRNVAKTAPYFHDGSIVDLKKAISLMGLHQLGTDLKESEVEAIYSFLNSLTGKIPDINKI